MLLFFTTLETAKSRDAEINPPQKAQSCSAGALLHPGNPGTSKPGGLESSRARFCFGIASGEKCRLRVRPGAEVREYRHQNDILVVGSPAQGTGWRNCGMEGRSVPG